MENTASFSCSIGTTNSDVALGLEIYFNGGQILNLEHVKESIQFKHEFADTDGDHELKFVLKNKLAEHTVINESGEIVADACLTIKNPAFDEIDLGQMFAEQAEYQHDFNGSGKIVKDKFFGIMGCNGQVSLSFSTPIYLWLLENM